MDLMDTAQLLGNFGEFVGAIAVVITLLYLALQVRYGREATEANTKIGPAWVLLMAALLSGHAAGAEELDQRLGGTWVLQGVEEKDAAGSWVAREAPNIGMLIYLIVGPMSGGVVGPAAVGGPANVRDTGNTQSAPSERAVMTIGDGDVRLIWTLSPPVR